MAGFNLTELLNNASLASPSQTEQEEGQRKGIEKIVHLSCFDLVPSKDNFYSVEEIEELKDSIEIFGIKQNLNVEPLGGGKYKIIAGHRRNLASKALVEEGKTEFEFVPCAIEPKTEDDDPLNRLLLIMTNSTARRLTHWEQMEQAKEVKSILEELKQREKLPGRTRNIIAKILKTSPAQIGRMEAVEKNLNPDFKEELQAGRVNFSTAYELSGLSQEEQKAAFEEYRESGEIHIKDAQEKKQEAATPLPPAEEPETEEMEPTHEAAAPPADTPQQEEKAHEETPPEPETERPEKVAPLPALPENRQQETEPAPEKPEEKPAAADIVSSAIAKISELNLKGKVKKCYLHRDYNSGGLQLNFEFDADAAEKAFSDKIINEIELSAYWE